MEFRENRNHGETRQETATLGGGCFWCLEAVYDQLSGVLDVVSGYSGGEVQNPSYREVCMGTTGHAEVIQIRFDPRQTEFADLLRIFFTIHDPTTLNRQGGDVGPQYRSVIFYHSPEQKQAAEQIIQEIEREGLWRNPIVTEISPYSEFYPAEEYHQEYFANNPGQAYCKVVIAPKVAKFRKQYMERLKS